VNGGDVTDLEVWLLINAPDDELDRWRAEFRRLLASGLTNEEANVQLVERMNRGERAPACGPN
jgi:predicted secreted protein